MKILYDSQIFWMQNFGGISRYFNKLCHYDGNRFDYTVSGKWSDNIYAPSLSGMTPFPIRRHFKGRNPMISVADAMSDRSAIMKSDYDIYHPTYYFVPMYPRNKPVIITAHDFIHELFPEFFPRLDRTRKKKKEALLKATRIIAISETTKKDLLKFYPDTPEEKIDVVLHAIEWKSRPRGVPQNRIPKPYILFTGQRKAYKNFLPFVEACAPILTEKDR